MIRNKNQMLGKSLLSALAISALGGASLHAAALIYEPFSQDAGNLSGATTGTGLAGNWSGGSYSVNDTASLSYAGLATSGGFATTTSISAMDSSATLDSSLSDAGLLDDGATLWFSVLMTKGSNGDRRAMMSIGDSGSYAFNRTIRNWDAGNPETGFGWSMNGNTVNAEFFSAESADTTSSGFSVDAATGPFLLVGKVSWGATSDTLDLYYIQSGTSLPGSPTVSITGNVDQSGYDILSIGSKTEISFDEIRFGASFGDVVVVPEPRAALLGGLGLLALLRRRR